MSDATPTDGRPLSGILIPECCLTVWDAETTLDEAEARPGRLVADRVSKLRVIPTGEPTTGEAWEIQASVGGVPGGGLNDDGGGARFLQRPTTDPAASWRGLDPPTSISSVEVAGTCSFAAYSATGVQTAAGVEVVVVEDHGVGGGYNTKILKAFRRSPAGSWGSAITIATLQSIGEAAPCLVLTESGRLDVYALDAIDSARRLVRYSSTDDGATWELASSSALRLEAVASATAVRLRVVAGGGQVLLVVNYSPSVDRKARQYASSDDGATFRLVGTYDDAWCVALAYDAGIFHCLWQTDDTSGIRGVYVELGSAFTERDPTVSFVEIFNDTGAEQTPIPQIGGGIWVDAAGVLYACWQTADNTATIDRSARLFASADGGSDWTVTGSVFGEGTEGAGWIHDLAIRRSRSGALASWVQYEPGGSGRSAVYVARLGGWTTSTMPGLVDQPASPLTISTWERGWIASQDQGLEDGGTWAESLTGVPTKTLAALSWRISGTDAMDATYVYDSGANSVHGHVRLAINPANGDGTTYVTLTVAKDAAPDRTYEIRLEVFYDLGTYQITDVASAAVLFGPSAIPASSFEVWMAIGRKSFADANGIFGGFARRRLLSGDPEDRAWTVLVDAPTLSVATATNPNTSKVTIETNPGGTAAWDLTLLYVFADLFGVTGAGLGLADSTERLFGAPFTPRAQYVRDGVSVSATGLCRRLDSWTQATTYAYGIEQALPTTLADPRRGHKATTDSTGHYAFALEGGDAPRGGLWAIYLDGITWDQVAIAIYTSGAWSTIGTATLGEAVVYDSAAGVSYADEAPDTPRYYAEDELAGCWLEDGGGTIYAIDRNTEGVWSTTGQRAELYLDTDGDDGAATIRFKRGLILIYFSATTTFSALRLSPGVVLADPLETAVLAIGRVRVLGDGWDATESRVRDLGEVLAETATGGGATSRPRADRRVVELAHTRPVSAGDSGRYVRALTGGPAVATSGDPRVLDGVIGAAGKAPIVLIPRIPVLGGSSTRILAVGGESGCVYGRFAPETYRQEVVYTDDHGRESVRGSTVTIVEEVG